MAATVVARTQKSPPGLAAVCSAVVRLGHGSVARTGLERVVDRRSGMRGVVV